MKHMRKIATLLLALAMILSMATSVFAETEVGASEVADAYTITAPANGRVYNIYQIFTGELVVDTKGTDDTSDDVSVLSNIAWGQNGTGTTGESVDEDTLAELTAITANTSSAIGHQDISKASKIAAYADLTGDPYATVTNGEEVSVAAGYYLVKEVTEDLGTDAAYSTYVIFVAGKVTINPKEHVPTVVKKVKDTDDSAGVSTDWQDSADYDVGDTITFQLKAQVAENYNGYSEYKLVFHDTLTNMKFEKITSVKAYAPGGSELTGLTFKNADEAGAAYTYEYNEATGDLTITFKNLRTISTSASGTDTKDYFYYNCYIGVEYQATLLESAVSGSAGNDNSVYLEYSNNPYDTASTGTTTTDTVTVFTYDMIVNKIDGTSKAALAGAEFQLSKLVGGTYQLIDTVTVSGDADNVFTWHGLDDGQYKLVESVTPAGYNTISDKYFTITAEHAVTSDDPALTKLTLTYTDEKGIALGEDAVVAGALDEGKISIDVENNAGSTLPSTGGIGTTIFYILGGALVLVAVVLLVTKRRMAQAR